MSKFKNKIIEATAKARQLFVSVWPVDQLPYAVEPRGKVLVLFECELKRDAFLGHGVLRLFGGGRFSVPREAIEAKLLG